MNAIEPLLRAADQARLDGDLQQAEALYARVLAQAPERGGQAAMGLALSAFARTADVAAATRDLRRSVLLDTGSANAWTALGYVRLLAGDTPAAADAFAAAVALDPDDVALAMRRAETAAMAGQGAAVRAALAARWEAEPGRIAPAAALALLMELDRDMDAAVDVLEAVCLLQPDAPLPVALLGSLLARAGRLRASLPVLRDAHARNPGRHATQNDLATVLMRLHRPAEAAALLAALDADFEAAGEAMPLGYLCNYAVATSNLGEQAASVAIARRAAAEAPAALAGWRAISNTLPYAAHATGPALLEAAVACSRVLTRPDPAPFSPRQAGAPLRVGLLSGSLRQHPVGWLTIAAFEALPREAFTLVAFSDHDGADPIARRFKALCGAWHGVAGLPDERVADLIREARIDILFDLGGWGDYGRMAVCARRAAPVQIKWVGMQNHSSGLPEMDYFLTDRWETPDDHAAFYSERLLRMPDGYVCYAPPADAPDVTPLPALRRGHVTFGCFNSLAKLTPDVVAAWSRILGAAPETRLTLKMQQLDEASTRDAVLARFAAEGIGPARLTLLGSSSHRGQLEAHAHVDIMLDPFPYSGGLTTVEALWMGVPTLTLPGTTFASRHSLSHLTNVGLADWSARDQDDYVAQAVARAADVPALAALRDGLRARVAASPLVASVRFGANLATALRAVWSEAGYAGPVPRGTPPDGSAGTTERDPALA